MGLVEGGYLLYSLPVCVCVCVFISDEDFSDGSITYSGVCVDTSEYLCFAFAYASAYAYAYASVVVVFFFSIKYHSERAKAKRLGGGRRGRAEERGGGRRARIAMYGLTSHRVANSIFAPNKSPRLASPLPTPFPFPFPLSPFPLSPFPLSPFPPYFSSLLPIPSPLSTPSPTKNQAFEPPPPQSR